MAEATLTRSDTEDLFSWLVNEGKENLLDVLGQFLDSRPVVHMPEGVGADFPPYYWINKLRESYSVYMAIQYALTLKETEENQLLAECAERGGDPTTQRAQKVVAQQLRNAG